MAGEHLHPGPLGRVLRQQRRAECLARRPIAEAPHDALLHHGQRPGVRPGLEGVEPVAVRLAQFEPGPDLARHDGNDASHAFTLGNGHGIQQVLRTIRLDGGRRPHRGGQYDRLLRRQHALQQVGGLFQRVGAVRDHHAADLGPVQVLPHPLRQPRPGGVVHVLAVDLGQLFSLQRLRRERRDRLHQRLHRQRTRLVADVVHGAAGGAGDRPAGADDHEGLGRALQFVVSCIKIQMLDGFSGGFRTLEAVLHSNQPSME